MGLARELAGRLRGLGCADREMLVGGLGRPAGLPLLHLALLSGSVEMVGVVRAVRRRLLVLVIIQACCLSRCMLCS